MRKSEKPSRKPEPREQVVARVYKQRSADADFLKAQGYDPAHYGGRTFVTAWRAGLIEVHWKAVERKDKQS